MNAKRAIVRENMKKNAFLIMAHNEFDILKKLLELLDHEDNDFYIHVDVKAGDINELEFQKCLKKSQIYFVERMNVSWGGDSQIWCEFALLEQAVKHKYKYYHLISGVDLPIKNVDEINKFFDGKDKEYIGFDSYAKETGNHLPRIQYYYVFQNKIAGRSIKNIDVLVYKGIQYLLLQIQKLIKVNRIKKAKVEFLKGNTFFDITHGLATYVVSQKGFIEKYFSNTFCADEVFLQTLVMMSPYANNVSRERLRYIDWKRGNPYTFTMEEYGELASADSLFARKFSTVVDKEIVEKIYNNLKEKNSL